MQMIRQMVEEATRRKISYFVQHPPLLIVAVKCRGNDLQVACSLPCLFDSLALLWTCFLNEVACSNEMQLWNNK